MKKNLIMVSIVALILVGIAGIFYYIVSSGKEQVNVKEVQTTNDDGETITNVETTVADPSDDKPEKHFSMNMSEGDVQQAIHGMSHQKVQADKKWHFELLTKKRVKRLLKVVEHNDYEHKELYVDILKRWAKDDFSKVVKDHNDIWDLQDGTVGVAKGKLSAEEEKQFIDENYEVVE